MSSYTTPWLFADHEGGYEKQLKAQRYALYVQQPESDYPRVLQYLLGVAFAPKFSASVLANLPKALEERGILQIEDNKDCEASWVVFNELYEKAMIGAPVVPGVASAMEFLHRGVRFLATHIDKSSELPQSSTARDGFLKGLGKSLKTQFPEYESKDSRILVINALGNEDLPLGVTMTTEEQAALGIVCSSERPLVTSVGDAKNGPAQNFFMINFGVDRRVPYNMLRVFMDERNDIIGKMLGLDHTPSEGEMRLWLGQKEGVKPFLAALYFGVIHMIDGRFEAEVLLTKELAESKIQLPKASLFNNPVGTGLNHVRLPVADGYHHATPINNAGLVRDVHNSYYLSILKDDPFEWRRQHTTVSVGGSKPQNSGTFFTSIVGNGKVKAFQALLPQQHSPGSQVRDRLKAERTLYWVTRDRALRVCHRPRFENDADALAPLYPPAAELLGARLDDLVKHALAHLARASVTVNKMIDQGEITMTEILGGDRLSKFALAEREILLGCATQASLDGYAHFLQLELYEFCNLTRSERGYISRRLRESLYKFAGEPAEKLEPSLPKALNTFAETNQLFLSIPFSYSAANIRPNDMIAGMPSMSAVGGMVHNIQRVIRDYFGWNTFKTGAFSLVYFSLDRDKGTPRRPPQEPAGGLMTMPSLMDIRRAHGKAAITICITFEDESERQAFDELLASEIGTLQINQALSSSLRFAGGSVFLGLPGEHYDQPLDLAVSSDWMDILRSYARAYPTQGLLIEDMSQELGQKARSEDTTVLKAMTAMIYQSALLRPWTSPNVPDLDEPLAVQPTFDIVKAEGVEPNRHKFQQVDSGDIGLGEYVLAEEVNEIPAYLTESYQGLLLPAVVGFHGVCSPRGGQHFVEPALSVIRAVNLDTIRDSVTLYQQDWRRSFWAYEHVPEHYLYRVTGYQHALPMSAPALLTEDAQYV
ncbi:hypothetical protein HNP46_004192 [Pseudomonas nitritireducens]|uniref:Uncharacterized protein n=1 Tax=Pseudomonas nitroreducens TaxID=46680 RepID=A0A7W7P283_PSENT|nr:hypothetical protein [Pseudomonas nitritireducens]MBB4865311.1 hypothetical protein [Pseudomonas nitritireducens]